MLGKYKEDAAMGWTLTRVIIAGSMLTFVCLLLPAIFGGRDDVWGQFIYDYQSLIAGMLAVFAAAIAVSQSAVAEASQERRHREQMFLSQRRDLFAISRMANDLTLRLNYVAERSREFDEFELPNSVDGWSREACTTYLSLLRSASRLFDRMETIGDLERGLFDAELEVSFVLYRRQLEELLQNFPDRDSGFPEQYPNSNHAPAKYDQGIRAQCIGLANDSRDFLSQLQRWRDEIEKIYQT
jgi:hypothetical protein